MKKSFLLLLIVFFFVGTPFVSELKAQSDPPTWGPADGLWRQTDNYLRINAPARLRVDDRIVSPALIPRPADLRLDIGMGPTNGGNLEMYRSTHPTQPGVLAFIYGGGNLGEILFTHYNGSQFNTRMMVDKTGNLFLDGKVTAKEIEVKLDVWPDYVFNDNYNLRSISEVEQFININRHLPDVPSEAEVLESGVNLGEMSAVLLKKIEELTLYLIDLNNKNQELSKRIEELENK